MVVFFYFHPAGDYLLNADFRRIPLIIIAFFIINGGIHPIREPDLLPNVIPLI